MPATIRDVAKKAGVGIGTVSSVLNNSRPVNQTTRNKVMAAVDELDFVPNPSGRRLSMGKTHTIGVVVPFFTSPSQIKRLRGVMTVISDSDYDISLFAVETPIQRNKVLQTVPRRGRIDGLLIISVEPTEEDVERIRQHNIPTVLIEAYHPKLHSIEIDDVSASKKAVDYLIELGHRKIGYISEYLDNKFGIYGQHRYHGYCQACELAGIPINPSYLRQCNPDREEGRLMALELLNLPDPPTAIFAYSDVQALGALEAAREMGLNVPNDLSVVGYDDIDTAHFAQLTTVRQHLFETGMQGVEYLLDAIEKSNLSPVHIQLPTELVIRQTTAPPGLSAN